MNTKTKPSWLNNLTDIEKKNDIEPFSPNEYKPNTEGFKGALVVAKRANGGNKIAYPLRIDEDINNQLAKDSIGSKNAVINLLLKYALADLKAKNITLTD